MPNLRVEAPPRAFAVHPDFDNLDGDTDDFVRLVKAGHVFSAWDVFVGREYPSNAGNAKYNV